jgi:hypothetical protein
MALFGLLHPLPKMAVVLFADEAGIVGCRRTSAHAAFNSIGSGLA